MRISTLIFISTIHFAYLKVYTKFHNPKSSSCWENSDKKRPYVYIGVTEGMKKVNKKCLLDTPGTVRVSEKTWQVIVRTRRP